MRLVIARPYDIDIDSTVQEANMTYPTDAKMLRKLGNIAFKVVNGLKQFIPAMNNKTTVVFVDLKTIASKARSYFFLKKKASNEENTNSSEKRKIN